MDSQSRGRPTLPLCNLGNIISPLCRCLSDERLCLSPTVSMLADVKFLTSSSSSAFSILAVGASSFQSPCSPVLYFFFLHSFLLHVFSYKSSWSLLSGVYDRRIKYTIQKTYCKCSETSLQNKEKENTEINHSGLCLP